MNNNRKFLFIVSKIAEVYPIGHSKYAPGTLASLIAVILGYFLLINLQIKVYVIFLLFFIIFSYFLCEAHLKLHNKKDPKEIVIDEFTGQFIAILACINSENVTYMFSSLITAFILFRFFDITKMGLIKKCESLPKGVGIMADDIAAGICAFITQAAILTGLDQPMLIKSLWS